MVPDKRVPLPDEADLLKLYTTFRQRFFKDCPDRMPPARDVTIRWSNRFSSSAGSCYPTRRIINLSTHYHQRRPEDIPLSLLHEMIHFVVPGHGRDFRREMDRIRRLGGQVERYAREPARPYRYRYTCRQCRQQYHRARRLKAGGRYHRCSRCGSRLSEDVGEFLPGS